MELFCLFFLTAFSYKIFSFLSSTISAPFRVGDRLVKWRRRLRAQKQEAFPCAKTHSLSRLFGRKRDLVFLNDHISCLARNFEIPYSNLNSFQIFTPLRGRGRPHRDQRFSRLSFSQSHVLLGVPKPHILQHFCTAINKKHWCLPWSLGSNAQGICNGYTTKKRDATLVCLAGLTLASNTVDSPSSFLMLIRAYCCRKIAMLCCFCWQEGSTTSISLPDPPPSQNMPLLLCT